MEPTERATIEAAKAQRNALEHCATAGLSPPPYVLKELVGKGAYGRVYKANATTSGQLVAVKVISIEEGDKPDPRAADTIGDILKEIGAVQHLSQSGAKNINAIIDTFILGHSVWLVTAYARASVATLMKPTGCLAEKWAVPILRETAVAIYWVHEHGFVHRDIKCANVLVTDNGGIQLCDFGVAAALEKESDKRRTVIGTLHWMPPELFDDEVQYGKEVDIWAFGAMAYELITGKPPNAMRRVDRDFGAHLRYNPPRLQGNQYSEDLQDFIMRCLTVEPSLRPTIAQIQKHVYILDTDNTFPTESLVELLSAYQLWQSNGGTRQSLFTGAGAQGAADESFFNPGDWNFDEYQAEDAEASHISGGQQGTETRRPRRRPPQEPRRLPAPLERVFDPNTISKYEENSRAFYREPVPQSDLPLRGSDHESIRESLIDLDDALNSPSYLTGVETIRPRPRSSVSADRLHRRTLDWTFPSAPASASPRVSVNPLVNVDQRMSASSLIDLDASILPHTTSQLNHDPPLENRESTPPAEESIPCSLPDATRDKSSAQKSTPALRTGATLSRAFPRTPELPSLNVMEGSADQEEIKDELRRLMASLKEHFQEMGNSLS